MPWFKSTPHKFMDQPLHTAILATVGFIEARDITEAYRIYKERGFDHEVEVIRPNLMEAARALNKVPKNKEGHGFVLREVKVSVYELLAWIDPVDDTTVFDKLMDAEMLRA